MPLDSALCVLLCALVLTAGQQTPVIIDTDIGSCIDDHFAIAYALNSKDLDVKFILTCSDDTTARAKVLAKLLTLIGHDNVPIGIGVKNNNHTHHDLFDWARDVQLSQYRGGVFADGVEMAAKVIEDSHTTVSILAIGPMTNFPVLLDKHPQVVNRARVYAMAGSMYKGYYNSSGRVAEYNVAMCPWCAQQMLSAGWLVSITPLDTCGLFSLNTSTTEDLLSGTDQLTPTLASGLLYYCMATVNIKDVCVFQGPNTHYPVLYDAVATLLTLSPKQYLIMEPLPLTVNSTGYLEVNKRGSTVEVALNWTHRGMDDFTLHLVQTLKGDK